MTVKFICPSCGSDSMLIDAFAGWDTDTQEWVLQNTFPQQALMCDDCGDEANYETARQETE